MSRGWGIFWCAIVLSSLAWCTDDSKHVTLHQAMVDYIVAVTPK